MKKMSVIVLVVVSLSLAGFAEAAKPKKRTRNANRVGAYGSLARGAVPFSAGPVRTRTRARTIFSPIAKSPTRDISVSSETENIGFQATFGYRFNRDFAAELGLVQFGELSSTVRGDIDQGNGFVPANVKFAFNVAGPMVSAVGNPAIRRKGGSFCACGFSVRQPPHRKISARVDGQNGGATSAKGDSQEPVYGIGSHTTSTRFIRCASSIRRSTVSGSRTARVPRA
jgi:hypothetical protein